MLSFWIPLTPTPMSRPRFTRRGRTYTAETTRKAMTAMVSALLWHAPETPLTGAFKVVFTAYLPTPKYASGMVRRTRAVGDIPYQARKPDVDNLGKFLLDCMTRAGFWADDGIVSVLYGEKVYDEGAGGWDVSVEKLR